MFTVKTTLLMSPIKLIELVALKHIFPHCDSMTSISLIGLFKLSVKPPSAHLVPYNEIPSYTNTII